MWPGARRGAICPWRSHGKSGSPKTLAAALRLVDGRWRCLDEATAATPEAVATRLEVCADLA